MLRLCSGLFILTAWFAAPVTAQEWTRFRGPNGSGISDHKSIPLRWSNQDLNWKLVIPGEGHGSPVLWGDQLFIQSADPKTAQRHVLCIDALKGTVVWQKDFASETYNTHKFNNFGSSTPAVDAQRLYVYWTTPKKVSLMALKITDGSTLWERDLGPFESQHGGGTSPMLYEDLVIVTNDHMGKSSIVALDAATGKTKWVNDRGVGGKGATAYGVLSVYQPSPKMKPQLVHTSKAHGISAIDPNTGKTLWEKADLYDKRSASCALVVGDLVIGTCGSGGGGNYVVAVRPTRSGVDLAWKVTKSSISPYVPTSLYFEGHIYMVSDSGIASCVDPKNGNVIWSERIGGDYFASPVIANGVVYAASRQGEVVAFRASPKKFEELGRSTLDETTHATPAIAGGRLYLRTIQHLISVGGVKTASAGE